MGMFRVGEKVRIRFDIARRWGGVVDSMIKYAGEIVEIAEHWSQSLYKIVEDGCVHIWDEVCFEKYTVEALFKIGDLVKISPNLNIIMHPTVIYEMLKYKSMITKIVEIEKFNSDAYFYRVSVDDGSWHWHESLLDPVVFKNTAELLHYTNKMYDLKKLKIQMKE